MNTLGNAVRLRDAGGTICDGIWRVFVAVQSTLTGSLTITGITNTDGTPAAWTLNPGTTPGVYAAPGSGLCGANTAGYSLSNVGADADKAIAIYLSKS
jgi:hypothetical protein